MKYSNLIILILIFTIIFNFTFQSKKSYSASIPLAVKFGVPVAEKLIAFLFASLAVGVTYQTLDDAKTAFDKWLSELPEYEPPRNNQGGSGNGWKDSIYELLKVSAAAGAINDLWDNIKDWFQNLGAKEGDNIYEGIGFTDSFISPTGKIYYKVTDGSVVYPSFVNKKYFISGSGGKYNIYRYIRFYFYKSGDRVYVDVEFVNDQYDKNDKYLRTETYKSNPGTFWCTNLNTKYGLSGLGFSYQGGPIPLEVDDRYLFKYEEDPSEVPSNGGITEIPYYVEPYSPVITGENPFEEPYWYQPNILDIVPTTTIINSQGIKETIYDGTVDDLVNDLISNITFEDIQNSKKREPYTFTQKGSSIVIETGQESEVPYPEPEPDTQTALSKIISLLKQIINWESNIYDKIGKLPEPEPEPEPEPLELPEKVEIDFEPLKGLAITDKFPFSLPWDIKRVFELFQAEPEPPYWEIEMLGETIIIDFKEFNELASISRNVLKVMFVAFLVVVTRRFITGA